MGGGGGGGVVGHAIDRCITYSLSSLTGPLVVVCRELQDFYLGDGSLLLYFFWGGGGVGCCFFFTPLGKLYYCGEGLGSSERFRGEVHWFGGEVHRFGGREVHPVWGEGPCITLSS